MKFSIPKSNDMRQQVFAVFWALAILMNNFKQGPSLANSAIESFLNLVIFLLAVSLLLDPKSTLKLILISVLSSIQWVGFLPRMPNHWMIIGLVSVAVFMVWTSFRLSSSKHNSNWFGSAERILRLSFVICYGAAALAKWNSGFMNLSASCSVTLAERELGWLGLNINFSDLVFFPWLIASIETMIFIFLLLPKTRFLGVLTASLFHLTLSLTPISQGLGFTYTLWPLLLLFLPDQSLANLKVYASTLRRFTTFKLDIGILKFLTILLWGYIFFKYLIYPDRNQFDELFIWLLRIVAGLIIALLVAMAAWAGRKSERKSKFFSISGVAQYLVLVVVLINVLSPYIGLKTHSTMTMYSNLKVEGGETNHYFLPIVSMFPFLSDTVSVKATNLDALSRGLGSDLDLTWIELQRIMSSNPEFGIAYERDGETYVYERASENSELTAPHPIILKLLSNRAVSKTEKCLW